MLGERDMDGPLEIAFYAQAIRCEHFSGFSLSDFSSFLPYIMYYLKSMGNDDGIENWPGQGCAIDVDHLKDG